MFALALAITANATYPDSSSSHPYGTIQQKQPQWPANGGIAIFEASRMETTTVGSRSKTRHRRRLNAIVMILVFSGTKRCPRRRRRSLVDEGLNVTVITDWHVSIARVSPL